MNHSRKEDMLEGDGTEATSEHLKKCLGKSGPSIINRLLLIQGGFRTGIATLRPQLHSFSISVVTVTSLRGKRTNSLSYSL